MSEEQLSALLAKLNEDAGFRKKLEAAGDLDTALALAQEAGFDISKADWIRHQARQSLELSDQELEGSVGGFGSRDNAGSCYKSCDNMESTWVRPQGPCHETNGGGPKHGCPIVY